eukprot:g47118.t1
MSKRQGWMQEDTQHCQSWPEQYERVLVMRDHAEAKMFTFRAASGPGKEIAEFTLAATDGPAKAIEKNLMILGRTFRTCVA